MVQDAAGGEIVAANGTSGEKRPNFFARIVIFFRQVVAELRKVVTPTRSELMKFTAVVLGFVVIMMGFVYGLDYVFSWVATVVFGVPR
ncbi:preprotein translocase subunit SecE [Microbacterium album]|uniref:Protein translocase subunit SecE n=1 Tax=Microbacterium album TaxID=2053191 RepID=A0A917ID18_9MICO|nr:preprotein translocase subunit SecE [Microbacterium album]GGH36591.1 protein translocase subunit SecE [Microbacterium album]